MVGCVAIFIFFVYKLDFRVKYLKVLDKSSIKMYNINNISLRPLLLL